MDILQDVTWLWVFGTVQDLRCARILNRLAIWSTGIMSSF